MKAEGVTTTAQICDRFTPPLVRLREFGLEEGVSPIGLGFHQNNFSMPIGRHNCYFMETKAKKHA